VWIEKRQFKSHVWREHTPYIWKSDTLWHVRRVSSFGSINTWLQFSFVWFQISEIRNLSLFLCSFLLKIIFFILFCYWVALPYWIYRSGSWNHRRCNYVWSLQCSRLSVFSFKLGCFILGTSRLIVYLAQIQVVLRNVVKKTT
jgi:hypothetical protein